MGGSKLMVAILLLAGPSKVIILPNPKALMLNTHAFCSLEGSSGLN
jgi:hypothetical protein